MAIVNLTRQKGNCTILAHRSCEEEALGKVTVMIAQKCRLRLGLDSLGRHIKAKGARQPEQGRHDRCILGIGFQIADEGAIDLDLGDRELLEMHQ